MSLLTLIKHIHNKSIKTNDVINKVHLVDLITIIMENAIEIIDEIGSEEIEEIILFLNKYESNRD